MRSAGSWSFMKPWPASGLETFVVGGAAAVITYGLGSFLENVT